MSLIPLNGNQILVDTPDSEAQEGEYLPAQPGASLVGWIVSKTTVWKDQRYRGYDQLWGKYWRLYRGKWAEEDQNRQGERARVITPALAQAIESSVAEAEEAIFGQETWFDAVGNPGNINVPPQVKLTMYQTRDNLAYDLDRVSIKSNVTEALTNGAIFGTILMQCNVDVVQSQSLIRDPQTQELQRSPQRHVQVSWEAVRPDEFIPDPAGNTIEDMLGCAVERVKPIHSVLEKIQAGIYRKDALPYLFPQMRSRNYDLDREVDPQSAITTVDTSECTVLEYHGKVLLGDLLECIEDPDQAEQLLTESDNPDSLESETYVEAIVTIANDGTLLRAIPNPFIMKDRSIIAAPWEKVPGRFWGRGVAEKGYNPQIALDATVRAYIDALAFISAPMLGVDSGRLINKGGKNSVYPGRVWLTQGPPQEVIAPVQIGQFQPALFQQSSEMERMVQMGTGAFDTATALNGQSQSGANSATANSMLMGAFVKRSKRAVSSIARLLLTPLVTKTMWRYAQFAPTRYPLPVEFEVKTTMGIVAREAEAMQLTQLIGMVGNDFPQIKALLAKGIIKNTAIQNKGELMAAIDQALAPNPQQQQQQAQLQHMQYMAAVAQAQGELLKNQLTLAQIRNTLANADLAAHKAAISVAQISQEQERIHQQYLQLANEGAQTQLEAHKLVSVQAPLAHASLVDSLTKALALKHQATNPEKSNQETDKISTTSDMTQNA